MHKHSPAKKQCTGKAKLAIMWHKFKLCCKLTQSYDSGISKSKSRLDTNPTCVDIPGILAVSRC